MSLHRINIEPVQTTLVPKQLFSLELGRAIVELNFKFDQASKHILTETYNDIIFLSIVDKKVYDSALVMFPNGEYCSTSRLLFQTFEKLAQADKHHRNRHHIFAHILPNALDLFIFEKHRPIFVNQFPLKTSRDLLYILLQTTNRLKIDTGGLTLRLIDSSDHSEDLTTLLEAHFMSIEELSDKDNPLNLRIPIQLGFSLINSLCE
jgi:hypothetical protein